MHVILYVDERGESCKTIYGSLLLKLLDTTVYDKVCPWFATGRWFSLGTPVSSTNKTDHKN
jgi:hypothetical protein